VAALASSLVALGEPIQRLLVRRRFRPTWGCPLDVEILVTGLLRLLPREGPTATKTPTRSRQQSFLVRPLTMFVNTQRARGHGSDSTELRLSERLGAHESANPKNLLANLALVAAWRL